MAGNATDWTLLSLSMPSSHCAPPLYIPKIAFVNEFFVLDSLFLGSPIAQWFTFVIFLSGYGILLPKLF